MWSDFGFEKILSTDKTSKIQNLFSKVSNSYNIMNDIMSFGSHRIWKDNFVNDLQIRKNAKILDIAGGTGDISKCIVKKFNFLTPSVNILDLTPSMLENGRDDLWDEGIANITWTCGNAESIPFPDNCFDNITISFGLRNITNKEVAINEMYRILKPGGSLSCMEFSKINNIYLKKIYELYSFNLIPKFGKVFANDEDSYKYLVESISVFPDQERLKIMFSNANFKNISVKNIMDGLVAIHTCKKEI